MAVARYLTAREAAAELGITLPTLYAYVSRGLVRSEGGAERRARRYRAEDIQRLKERKEQRRDPARAAETALYLGAPVLESAITLIDGGRLYYRGRDALELAATRSVEQVATWLWTSAEEPIVPALSEARSRSLPPGMGEARRAMRGVSALAAMQALLPLAAASDPAGYDLRPEAVAAAGARILWLLTLVAAGRDRADGDLAQTLQRAWAPADARASALIGAALVLCADHELPVTTFVARCVAAVNSTPYAVVQAAMAAALGVDHGAKTRRTEAFLREAGTPQGMRGAIERSLARNESLPGFDHPLYPDGDPRALAMLRMVEAAYPDAPVVALAYAAVAEAHDLLGVGPALELGLVTVATALGLSSDGALTLFALGRTIGWVAHAIEQYTAHTPMRPRARYIGPPPGQ